MHDYYLLLVGTGIDELLGCRVLESSKYVNNHRSAVYNHNHVLTVLNVVNSSCLLQRCWYS